MYSRFVPELPYLAEVCMSLPVSNAWLERGASAVKRLKTRLRSSLKGDMLESLMYITINGPEVQECESLVKKAVKKWHEVKARRKIAKSIPVSATSSNCPTVSNAAVQVDMLPPLALDVQTEQLQVLLYFQNGQQSYNHNCQKQYWNCQSVNYRTSGQCNNQNHLRRKKFVKILIIYTFSWMAGSSHSFTTTLAIYHDVWCKVKGGGWGYSLGLGKSRGKHSCQTQLPCMFTKALEKHTEICQLKG